MSYVECCESDLVLHTLAGPEIGVASTKAFTTQLTTMACLVLALAFKRGNIKTDERKEYADALRHLPTIAAEILKHDDEIKGAIK